MQDTQENKNYTPKSFFKRLGSFWMSLGQKLKSVGNAVPEITPEELKKNLARYALIDVRSETEFFGELSHVPDAKLITLGKSLDEFLKIAQQDKPIVFICRSGARSASATAQSRYLGFTKTFNLQGGMLLWNQKKYEVE